MLGQTRQTYLIKLLRVVTEYPIFEYIYHIVQPWLTVFYIEEKASIPSYTFSKFNLFEWAVGEFNDVNSGKLLQRRLEAAVE